MTGHTDSDGEEALEYRIRLLIRHPSMDPARITSALGLETKSAAMAGAERRTPTGQLLPGLHKSSSWSHWYTVSGHRRFFEEASKMIGKLEARKDLFAEIERDGGSICLIIDLPGKHNIGSVLGWRDMARLAALKIDLGIEVFP